jgi:hypothetical protein
MLELLLLLLLVPPEDIAGGVAQLPLPERCRKHVGCMPGNAADAGKFMQSASRRLLSSSC